MRFCAAKILSLIFLFLFIPIKVYSWNAIGHMVIADIAYQNLKPTARAKVDEMVANLHKEYPNTGTFLQLAYWLDEIRGQHIDTYAHWHYIDVPFSTDGTPIKNTIDTDNAVWALNHIECVVKNHSANPYERARFLAFMVHIVGDLHQPLHTVSNITAARPSGDKGGNMFYVRYNNERINLHKIWDSGLGAFEGSNSPEHINQISATIMAMYPINSFAAQEQDLTASNWAKDGMAVAQKNVYDTTENQPVSNAYIINGRQVAEKSAALAGYRLANLLNQLLA